MSWRASPVPRVPRSRRDDRYDAGRPAPYKHQSAGWVKSIQDDGTCTVVVLNEDLTGLIPLDSTPTPGAIVEIESRGDLMCIRRWYEHPLPPPDEETYFRGTPIRAWHRAHPSLSGSYECTWFVEFKEPIYNTWYDQLLYTGAGSDLNGYSMRIDEYEQANGVSKVGFSYTNRGIPYTGWGRGEGNSGALDPYVFKHWILYHTADPGATHPHTMYGIQLWPYGTGNAPPNGTTDPSKGQFWIGPQIAGMPKPWRAYG